MLRVEIFIKHKEMLMQASFTTSDLVEALIITQANFQKIEDREERKKKKKPGPGGRGGGGGGGGGANTCQFCFLWGFLAAENSYIYKNHFFTGEIFQKSM